MPATLEQLRKAVGEDDAAGIAAAAHALKGASLNIGAEPLATLSGELRALAQEGSTNNAPQLMTQIDDLYVEVKAALEARLDDQQYEESA